MDRRQSLLALSAVAGHALFPDVLARFGRALAAAPLDSSGTWRPELLSVEEGRLLAELVETIIPETATPGARKAGVHVFVDLALRHCRSLSEQQTFVRGLGVVEADCRSRHGVAFAAAPTPLREDLLRRLEAAGDPFFALLKELTVLGYCTSELGATQGLAYVAVPGEYRGCVGLRPGQKSWATS